MVENCLYEFGFIISGADPVTFWGIGSLIRGLGSTIVHGVGAGLIGYAFARYLMDKNKTGTFINIILAYIAAVGLHAAWNGLAVVTSGSLYGLIIIMVVGYIMSAKATLRLLTVH